MLFGSSARVTGGYDARKCKGNNKVTDCILDLTLFRSIDLTGLDSVVVERRVSWSLTQLDDRRVVAVTGKRVSECGVIQARTMDIKAVLKGIKPDLVAVKEKWAGEIKVTHAG